MTSLHALVFALAALVLIAIGVEDLRVYRVRNGYVVALVVLFFVSSIVDGFGQRIVWHVVFGAIALGLLAGAFAMSLVGAGDAKLLAVCCLWVGPEKAALFAFSLFALCALYAIGAVLRFLPARHAGRHVQIPMGPSIAAAWFATFAITAFV